VRWPQRQPHQRAGAAFPAGREGALFQSTIDSEVIVHLIARSRRDGVDAQIDDALSQLEGAFSVVITVGTPCTRRATRTGSGRWCWASSPRRHRGRLGDVRAGHHGRAYIRDIEPGEVLRIRERRDHPTAAAGPQRPRALRLRAGVLRASGLAPLGHSVDRARRAFGRRLALEQPAEADCVIAVPDSANSRRWASPRQSGIPFELGLIRNHYVGRTFIEPSQAGAISRSG
jgi:amidophosphoribosyltransferase